MIMLYSCKDDLIYGKTITRLGPVHRILESTYGPHLVVKYLSHKKLYSVSLVFFYCGVMLLGS